MGGSLEWRTVDAALRTISGRRSALDAEEARWLRLAEELQIWRPLGMVSALDYMERVLGYAPRTAKERLRVARALGGLASLETALGRSELSYSAVRELTRVATPETEDAWLAAARDKSLRQIEELVADRKPGDRPSDPKDPAARMHVVRLELSAETFALFRQARQALDEEHGTSLSEDELLAALCHAALEGASPTDATGRAKYQVAVTVCERCQQGWQEGAGAKVTISAAAVERALCDAQHIGSIDDDAPARAYQDVSPSVSRLVWHRDAGRCRVPGCRSARGLEIHHIVHRADGGGHDPSNLVVACSSCHQAHHAGTLAISGTAEHLTVRRPARASSSVAETPIEGCSTDAAESRTGRRSSLAGERASFVEARAACVEARASFVEARASCVEARASCVEARASCVEARASCVEAREACVDDGGPGAAERRQRSAERRQRSAQSVSDTSARCAEAGQGRSAEPAGGGAHVDTAVTRPGPGEVGGADAGSAVSELARVREEAKQALIQSGWKAAIARAAVDAACRAGTAMSLERLVFEAYRRCSTRAALSG